jgi:hypothetical protein
MSAAREWKPGGVLSSGDVVRFAYAYAERVLILAFFFIAIAVLGIVFALLADETGTGRTLPSSHVFVLCWGLLLLGLPYLSARYQLRKQRYLREPMRFSFSEAGVRLEAPSFSSEVTWALVQCVRETKSVFLIYTSGQVAWFLPKRFFADASDVQSWKQFAIAHLQKPTLFRSPGWLSKRL